MELAFIIGIASTILKYLLETPSIQGELLTALENLFKAIAGIIIKHHPNPTLVAIATGVQTTVNDVQNPPPDVGPNGEPGQGAGSVQSG
jgi:hypothetical protein